MSYIIRSSIVRTWEIHHHPAEPIRLEAKHWEDAFLFWWSGQNVAIYETLYDIDVVIFSGRGAQTLAVHLPESVCRDFPDEYDSVVTVTDVTEWEEGQTQNDKAAEAMRVAKLLAELDEVTLQLEGSEDG